jgi:hypothetical protein
MESVVKPKVIQFGFQDYSTIQRIQCWWYFHAAASGEIIEQNFV